METPRPSWLRTPSEEASEALATTAWDAFTNLIFYGIGAFVILLINAHLHWLGLAGLAAYCVIIAFGVIRAMLHFALGVGTTGEAVFRWDTDVMKALPKLWAATVIRVLESIILASFALWLYHGVVPARQSGVNRAAAPIAPYSAPSHKAARPER